MSITRLPGAVVGGYFAVARLPLRAIASVSGEQNNELWPPAVALESVEATVETVLGGLLRDGALLESGRVRRAKVSQLRTAAELATNAEATREVADQAFTSRRQKAETNRQAATRRARQRRDQIQHETEKRKTEVETKAARKTTAARRAEAARIDAVDRRERAAKTEALKEAEQALSAQEKALDTAQTVDVIAETIEGNKASRSTS